VQSNSANPSPSSSIASGTSSGMPSPLVFGAGGFKPAAGLSLGSLRPVGLNLEALRDDVDQPLSELQVEFGHFHHMWQSKHQLMTAILVHVTSPTLGSERP
jgi:hypothetical protein